MNTDKHGQTLRGAFLLVCVCPHSFRNTPDTRFVLFLKMLYCIIQKIINIEGNYAVIINSECNCSVFHRTH